MKMMPIFKSMLTESIKFEETKKLGTVTNFSTKEWKKSPGDFTFACQAAAFYARKENADMLVIPSNSYGSKVFQVSRMTDDLRKYAPGIADKWVSCAMVSPDGTVYQGKCSQQSKQ